MIKNKIKGCLYASILFLIIAGLPVLEVVVSNNQYLSYYETFIRNCNYDLIDILTIITGGLNKSSLYLYLLLLFVIYAIIIYYNKKELPKKISIGVYLICFNTAFALFHILLAKINPIATIICTLPLVIAYIITIYKTAYIKIRSKLFRYLIVPFLTSILLFRFTFILMFMFNHTFIHIEDEKVKAVVIRKGGMHKGRGEVDIDALMNDTIINTEYDVHKINFVNIGDTIQVQRKKGKLGYYVYSSIINVYPAKYKR